MIVVLDICSGLGFHRHDEISGRQETNSKASTVMNVLLSKQNMFGCKPSLIIFIRTSNLQIYLCGGLLKLSSHAKVPWFNNTSLVSVQKIHNRKLAPTYRHIQEKWRTLEPAVSNNAIDMFLSTNAVY
ncbi:hypothetical protein ABZP36_017171 [Zizania latifolia]